MTESNHYSFSDTETRISKLWQQHNAFAAAQDQSGNIIDQHRAKSKPHVIVIPPPNVTGRLHMGHALNNTIQDILTRFKRMDGFDALWVPGTDHAGIATQTVVKKMLDAGGIDYREMGREKFVEKVWEWKKQYGDIILRQLEKIGSSCDWSRTAFTMDEGLSHAVRHTFKKLYDDGLIYRGERIVNWCPVDQTALSDDEVETKEGGEKGFLWHIHYPLSDGSGHLTVATTRPETLFGDVAVAVNPKDERFNKYIGQKVIVPLQDREVPVIGDDYVDMEFGTGCLKITPAHDPNDFEIGQRHKLKPINIMHANATMNDVVPERFRGLDRYKCREAAINELKEKGLLVHEEERMTPIGRSYRSGAAIEYRLSHQWFVSMKPLAEKVLKMHGELNIQPQRWNKVYLDWLNNIRDWCISRQIWWGHRVPVWYCSQKTCVPIVAMETPKTCPACGSNDLTQETDVLDTWFSSALWPMSTLGWPSVTPDFKRYFPTTTLATSKDIIFFWVARMNMMAAHFTGQLPYKNVYIHPVVLDERGETMSKSKGNGIDPLTVIDGATLEDLKQPVMEARPTNAKEILKRIEKNFPDGYEGVGSDALRYTLVYLCSGGQQLKISLNSFHDLGRRFLTKLWNASRFLFMNLEQEIARSEFASVDFESFLSNEDQWIRARGKVTAKKLRHSFETFDFTPLGETLYHFFWNDYCDWYVELAKVRFSSPDANQRRTALHAVTTTFADILRLLHPVIPFITEELWQKLLPLADQAQIWGQKRPASTLLIRETYPRDENLTTDDAATVSRFETFQNLVTAIRTLRKSYGISDGEKLNAWVLPACEKTRAVLESAHDTILRLARLENITLISNQNEKPKRVVTHIDPAFEVYLDVSAHIDIAKEQKRLGAELEKLAKEIGGLSARLANANFVNSANPDVVEECRANLAKAQDKQQKLGLVLEDLKGW